VFMNWRAKLISFWNFWPPFLGSGIQIKKVADDFRYMKVVLKKRWWNGNYVGTSYGGSMFSMTDPFYMVMLLRNLGKGYIVWDKAASIQYLKPGKTDLTAVFHLGDEDLKSIRAGLDENGKTLWTRTIDILDNDNQIVAKVEKVLYIRKK
jgi:hypothetical protein